MGGAFSAISSSTLSDELGDCSKPRSVTRTSDDDAALGRNNVVCFPVMDDDIYQRLSWTMSADAFCRCVCVMVKQQQIFGPGADAVGRRSRHLVRTYGSRHLKKASTDGRD